MENILVILLDTSKSIIHIKDNLTEMINNIIESKKKKNSKLLIYFFNDYLNIDLFYYGNIDNFTNIYSENLTIRGKTALFWAIDYVINDLTIKFFKNRKYNVTMLIITDGSENASKNIVLANLKSIITKLQINKIWNFFYFGANQNSYELQHILNFNFNNIFNYIPTNEGIKNIEKIIIEKIL